MCLASFSCVAAAGYMAPGGASVVRECLAAAAAIAIFLVLLVRRQESAGSTSVDAKSTRPAERLSNSSGRTRSVGRLHDTCSERLLSTCKPDGAHCARTVLIETPLTSYTWSLEQLAVQGSGTGISGTHGALVAIARRFAAAGWMAVLTGNLTAGPSHVPNICYLSPFPVSHPQLSHPQLPPLARAAGSVVFDLIVTTNVEQRPRAAAWQWQSRAATRALMVVFENQHLSGAACFRLGEFLSRQVRGVWARAA